MDDAVGVGGLVVVTLDVGIGGSARVGCGVSESACEAVSCGVTDKTDVSAGMMIFTLVCIPPRQPGTNISKRIEKHESNLKPDGTYFDHLSLWGE